MADKDILKGKSYPLGATVYPDGVNFCFYSHNGAEMELLLFDDVSDCKPRVIRLDPHINKTFYYWHIFVKGLKAGQLYGLRVYGPYMPEKGQRFDGSKVLVDPYSLAIAKCPNYDREAAMRPGDNCAHSLKSVIVDPADYDWEGDFPLHIPYSKTIIYELHVGGFTRHPSSGVIKAKQGTYDGLVEKIPYLASLGITAIELLPVQQFDEQDSPLGLKNYWGYSPLAFFAPHNGYSGRSGVLGTVNEFRDMVKAMHCAGIEVILDVVFNHTTEGDHRGPTLSYKGLENAAYYILEENPANYSNFTGCGNTVNANYSIVRRLISDCLCHWVNEMHVDGFRFDLASAMARGENGQPLLSPPILWSIDSNPVLAGTKIIAEAWDAAGLYQLGSFIGDRFSEWNGRFRDDVRRFVKGDSCTVTNLASRIMGSPDIYVKPDREPNRSINFITCHDGFTLNDLVSYNVKHNENNRQDSTDGANDNFSWNCGVEGETGDSAIETLRLRQIKNFFFILLISQGTPMLLMGDEVRRTQKGNNNCYCQDNELSWFDWTAVKKNQGLLNFVKKLIHFIKQHYIFQQERILNTTENSPLPGIMWHGVTLGKPDWTDNSHSIAFTLSNPDKQERLHVILNSYIDGLKFELPHDSDGKSWHLIIDTSKNSPEDFIDVSSTGKVDGTTIWVNARSCVLLLEM
jgi:glycogen operon protein